MHIRYYKEYSHNLRRDMEFKVYGHAGLPIVVFPCQDGKYIDFESRGMIDTIADKLEAGHVQLFCIGCVDEETWSVKGGDYHGRILWHEHYFRYVCEEFIPRLHQIHAETDGNSYEGRVILTGASMGGYHCVNFYLRRPDLFGGCLSLSGLFHAGYFFPGFDDLDIYYNSPVDYLPQMPYEHYLETGDRSLLELVYEPAQKYLTYAKYYRQDGLVCYGLSDWCPPDLPDLKLMDNCLSDSCYYYAMQQIMAKMAEFAGEPEKAKSYCEEAEETKAAIHNRFIQGDSVDNNGQGALAEVLYFRIVEGEQAEKIAQKLASVVTEDKYSYKVGILGLKALLNALSKYGYTDIAYKTVDRYDYPSYGYWKKLGATTLWECWENTSFGSQNHHMYADVVNWMFRNIGGLQNAGVAYDRCVLKPYFFTDTCSAFAHTETPAGEIRFAWEKKENRFVANIVLPKGTNAMLELPGCEPMQVGSGKLEIAL